MKNSLRGYPLDGCKMKLPENYEGVVYQETKRPLVESTKRFFKTKGIFSEFTYWNYDKEPSNNDALKQALVWNDFANVVSSASVAVWFAAWTIYIFSSNLQLHQPIPMEEFEKDTVDTAGGKWLGWNGIIALVFILNINMVLHAISSTLNSEQVRWRNRNKKKNASVFISTNLQWTNHWLIEVSNYWVLIRKLQILDFLFFFHLYYLKSLKQLTN